jgi:hypothetical protein
LKGARLIVLIYFFIIEAEEVVARFFFLIIFIVEGPGGMEVNFFLFHLTCGRGREGGLVFFLKPCFHCLGGGSVLSFSFDLLKGEGLIVFFKFIMVGVGVGLTNLILTKTNSTRLNYFKLC